MLPVIKRKPKQKVPNLPPRGIPIHRGVRPGVFRPGRGRGYGGYVNPHRDKIEARGQKVKPKPVVKPVVKPKRKIKQEVDTNTVSVNLGCLAKRGKQ